LGSQPRFTKQICALALVSLAAAYATTFFLGMQPPNVVRIYIKYALLVLVLIAATMILTYTLTLLVRREPRPIPKVRARAAEILSPTNIVDRVLPILLVSGFLGAFSVFKSLIPSIHAFAWDTAFSDFDRLIFGTDPWRLTHAFIGPTATRLIDYAYIMWVPVFSCVVFCHAVFAGPEQKRRFFLSFFWCWIILGIVCAMIFSSAGPCFLNLIDHPYAGRYPFFPLENGAGSQRIMDYLAKGYLANDFGAAKGISAMPSMHIAVVTLYLLTARKPLWVCLSLAYFILILVGSVHLGWHYAVDGIFAALGTMGIYAMTAPARRERPALMTPQASLST